MRQFLVSKSLFALTSGYCILMLLLDVGGIDIWLATKFYALEGYTWALKDYWVTEQLLHIGARKLNYVLALAILLITAYFQVINKTQPQLSKAFLALCLSLICSFTLVAYFKAISNVACPWSLSLFGGNEPYFHLLQNRPSYLPYSQCFPAGHASVGYAWVALYYFFKCCKAEYRLLGLAVGLTAGFILGLTQQLRGAHFMSHDITTLFICLTSARICFAVVFPQSKSVATSG
ncbi:phosphatase PAP2 family protein [Arsukibacterium perlucidum]|uniref:phosphatase PAP2 family protein n=1 Tax=Arsukibacterium perlucidum TaxID=368811 RepID=UPI00036E1AE0|nr:phosphatase PAP2 family protein [Arsukibacterium perlucidum]